MFYPLLLVVLSAAESPRWTEVQLGGKTILLHPKCEPLCAAHLGPFVKLSDGSVLAVDDTRALVSKDDGKTWSPRPLFARPEKYQCRGERAIVMTRDGTLILAFLNMKELALRWDQSQGGPLPECRLPVYVTRSTDDGKTWDEPRLTQDGYCGALRTMIQLQSGRVVLGSQQAVANPGRHVCFTCVSDDEGKTWRRGNTIDLGKYGGYGDHGGGIEPTLAELHDGRLWMLIRTYRGCFTEAFSNDGGLTWNSIRPSKIEASGSPGQLCRLQSGRLVLFWNRFLDKVNKTGRREQLSMAFSEDDGRTWTEPVVVGYHPMPPGHKEPDHRLSYPYVYEHVPGELWVTTMQGPLRIKLCEDDFFPRRLSRTTYRVRRLPGINIRLDGRADEPEWSRADVLREFLFPWSREPAPPTEFRALCDDAHLYFTFRVHDADIVVLDKLRNEEDAVFEDRVEIYFARDERMKDYYCIEVDSRGRAFDYRGSYYRRLDPKWNCPGLEAKASPFAQGYQVEGRIPLASLEALGFPRLRPGAKIRCGLFRAEFSHDRSGRPVKQRESIHNRGRQVEGPPPIERWMSWIDPRTEEPDFHVPTSLGWLEIVEGDAPPHSDGAKPQTTTIRRVGPIAGVEEIVFAVRPPGVDHWYANFGYYAASVAEYPPQHGIEGEEISPLFAHHGRNTSGVKRGEIKKLLVLEQLAKPVNFSGGMWPTSEGGTFTLARLLGTVPVEPDGSAYLEAPALRSLFFVALDEKDLAVKRVQSFLTVQPGETVGCVGCHERRTTAPLLQAGSAAVAKRRPSRIEPIAGVPDVLDFPRDVQPVFDRHCVACHNPDRPDGGVDLCGDHTPLFAVSYLNLLRHDLIADGRNERYGNRPPRTIGSSASRLLALADGSHYQAKPSPRERDVLRLWIESSAPYAGTYAALGSGMEPVEFPIPVMERRCGPCHGSRAPARQIGTGMYFRFGATGPALPLVHSFLDLQRIRGSIGYYKPGHALPPQAMVNLTRPEKSVVLRAPLGRAAGGLERCGAAVFADTRDLDYRSILAAIEEAAERHRQAKRFDMPGFCPNVYYVRAMQRYGILPASLDPDRPLDGYATDQAYWESFWHCPPGDSARR